MLRALLPWLLVVLVLVAPARPAQAQEDPVCVSLDPPRVHLGPCGPRLRVEGSVEGPGGVQHVQAGTCEDGARCDVVVRVRAVACPLPGPGGSHPEGGPPG